MAGPDCGYLKQGCQKVVVLGAFICTAYRHKLVLLAYRRLTLSVCRRLLVLKTSNDHFQAPSRHRMRHHIRTD